MPAAALIAAPTVDAASPRLTTGRARPEGDAELFAGMLGAPVEGAPKANRRPSAANDTPPARPPEPSSDEEQTEAPAKESRAPDQNAALAPLLVQPALTPSLPLGERPANDAAAHAAPGPAPVEGGLSGDVQPSPKAAATAPAAPLSSDRAETPTAVTSATASAPQERAAPSDQAAQAAAAVKLAQTAQPIVTPAPASPQQALQALMARAVAPGLPTSTPGSVAGDQDETTAPPSATTTSLDVKGEAPTAWRVAPGSAPPPVVSGASAALQQMRSALLGDGSRTQDGPPQETASSATQHPATAAASQPATPPPAPAGAAATPAAVPAGAEAAARADAAPATTAPAAPAPPPLDQTPAIAAARFVASGLSHAAIETTAQIAAQIVRRLEGRQTRFDMVLTPDHLGRVDVSIDIDADGQLAARLAFDNPAAAAELRGRVDELRRQLQDAGFQIAGDGLDFSERDGASRGGSGEREAPPAFARAARLSAAAEAASISATPAWASLSLTPDSVDVRV